MPKSEVKYFVTVLKFGDEMIKRSRCWGYFDKLEDAEEVVLQNITDIYEGNYYDHAVIEAIPQGITVTEEMGWYQAVYEPSIGFSLDAEPRVEKVDRPEFLKHIVHFSF